MAAFAHWYCTLHRLHCVRVAFQVKLIMACIQCGSHDLVAFFIVQRTKTANLGWLLVVKIYHDRQKTFAKQQTISQQCRYQHLIPSHQRRNRLGPRATYWARVCSSSTAENVRQTNCTSTAVDTTRFFQEGWMFLILNVSGSSKRFTILVSTWRKCLDWHSLPASFLRARVASTSHCGRCMSASPERLLALLNICLKSNVLGSEGQTACAMRKMLTQWDLFEFVKYSEHIQRSRD